jgi:hypothetical protein
MHGISFSDVNLPKDTNHKYLPFIVESLRLIQYTKLKIYSHGTFQYQHNQNIKFDTIIQKDTNRWNNQKLSNTTPHPKLTSGKPSILEKLIIQPKKINTILSII